MAVGAGVGTVVAIGTAVGVRGRRRPSGPAWASTAPPPPPGSTGTVAVSELVLAPIVPGALVSTGNAISSASPGLTKPEEKNPHVTVRPTGVPQNPTTVARVTSVTDPAW